MNSLNPVLLNMVHSRRPEALLDYGCGDGQILELIDPVIERAAYDPSPEMLQMLRQRQLPDIDIFERASSIPSNHFDLVILSMVIVCIPTLDVFKELATCIARVLKPGGTLIAATTHPCFRQYGFSDFKTSMGHSQPFEYLQDATPFEVSIHDAAEHQVQFVDYHWTLATTFRILTEAGLLVVGLTEIPDDASHPDVNSLVPPYIVFECRNTPP
ncbi:MAG TPA: class I SAM-dependent methyltransferase [Flavobacteriales bacterium]|nr:class I SAM-dependent methyltransferase [Flavobacteriales bacterium]HMR28800.1 class I SAM-dependent methyltransferase [Flavobacteriales bacterium]